MMVSSSEALLLSLWNCRRRQELLLSFCAVVYLNSYGPKICMNALRHKMDFLFMHVRFFQMTPHTFGKMSGKSVLGAAFRPAFSLVWTLQVNLDWIILHLTFAEQISHCSFIMEVNWIIESRGNKRHRLEFLVLGWRRKNAILLQNRKQWTLWWRGF